MSSAACEYAWRFRTKWFSGCEVVWAANAARSFFSVPTVIADTVIAAWPAATKFGSVNGVAPIAATSKVRKDGSITETNNGNIGSAGPRVHARRA